MLLRKPRIVEIEGKIEKLSLPIVTFPPFKLRAQLIEKDPVVWMHLLETYVKHFEFLNTQANLSKLDDSTLEQLCIFMRSYINEMANEQGKLLSLGMNNDVKENLGILRAWILTTIKACGLFYLQLFGESLWNLVILYVQENPVTIRSLIDGSHKPTISNVQRVQLNRINQIQQHLKIVIEQNKFSRIDLKSFQYLIDNRDFADKFLTLSWIEYLELWWDKGKGKYSQTAQQLLITTLLQVRRKSVVEVTKSLGISSLDTLTLYPLLGSLLVSERFNILRPDIKQELKYLSLAEPSAEPLLVNAEADDLSQADDSIEDILVLDGDISALSNFFPHLSRYQLSELLKRYDSNVELVTNLLFEDPSIMDTIPREKAETKPKKKMAKVKKTIKKEDDNEMEELQLHEDSFRSAKVGIDAITKKQVPDEVKNKTLARALKLLYDKDEDERDDTYDEAEVNRAKTSVKITVDGDEEVIKDDNDESNKPTSTYGKVEGYLWNLLKDDATLFTRKQRGSSIRKTMKQQTKWSDEQIEGWARMLEKSPQRARILEDKFMFRGNVKGGKTAYNKNRDGDIGRIPNRRFERKPERKPAETNGTETGDKPKVDDKRKNARNEKNKASKANHNRKAGRDKKQARAM